MKSLAQATLTLLPFCLLACGGGNTHEALAKQSLATMDKLATTLEGVKDKASWDAAKPALEKVLDTLGGIATKVKALPKPDAAMSKKLQESLGKQMGDIQKRMMGATMKLATIKEIGPDVATFMKKMGQRMKDMK